MDGEVKNVEHYSSQVQLHKQKSYFMVVAVTVVLPLILNNLKKNCIGSYIIVIGSPF